MKPLLGVVCYNRVKETMATLEALRETGACHEAEIVCFDNGSVDGTWENLLDFRDTGECEEFHIIHAATNVGCPAALNAIMDRYRKPGQDFIKVDNDVLMLTPGWVGLLTEFMAQHLSVGMAGPWYRELGTGNQGRIVQRFENWWHVFPVIGHCVLHRGEFLDRAGFFDVLGPGHLYGFEDLLMAHRAGAVGYQCAIHLATRMQNIQRHNSLDNGCGSLHCGESRDENIVRFRPEYERRIHLIHTAGGSYRVTRNGQIEVNE